MIPRKIPHISALLLIGLMLFESLIPATVYAQTSSPSPIPTQEQVPEFLQNLTATPSAETVTPQPDFTTGQNITSAVFRPPVSVARLAKASYQAKEKVEVIIRNSPSNDDFRVEVRNERNSNIKIHVDKQFVNGEFVFSINPEVGMTPGKYTVTVIDNSTNEVLSSQDFTWGVLAINTHKSIYAPGEMANIAMAVLDEGGRMVCDAVVDLEITAPWGEKTLLTTANGGVFVNRECLLHQVTERPDYEGSYVTSDIGRYLMTLTATTRNGTYTIKDRFEVREYVPFDVERITATRIYPPETYPVTLKIKANEHFRGKIVESVPQDFQITPGIDGTISYSEESVIPESYNPKTEANIPDLRLPFDGDYPVTQGFGEQIDDPEHKDVYKRSGLDGHDGLDFALPEGTPVIAIDGGKVILAQEKWIYGTSVVIEHSWGRSYYGHFSKLSAAAGDSVTAGQEIGLSGSTGLSTGPHLHFGLKPVNNDIDNLYFGKIDPAPFFGLATPDPTLSTADYPIAAKALIWNVDIEKGAEFTIGYHYKAPYKSPYFYSIGPLQFITAEVEEPVQAKFDVQENPFVLGDATPSAELGPTEQTAESSQSQASGPRVEEVIFSEIRQWQIASDADSTVVLDANGDGTCGSGCWTVPSDWTDVNTIYVIGGGGAGDNNATGAGGGGAGAFATITNVDLEAGNNVNFNVGAGGTDSVNGGNSWFCNNTTICANYTDTNVVVSAQGGTTATSITGGAGGSGGVSVDFAGGAGGTGNTAGTSSSGGGGGAGSPNGTGGTGGDGDSNAGGDEANGGGGGSGCDSIGSTNDGVAGGVSGGAGGDSCYAAGGTGPNNQNGNPGTRGSGGGGGDTGLNGGVGGDGDTNDHPSLSGGGGGGGDDDSPGVGGDGGLYGGGGGGGNTIGAGAGGVIVIIYTQLVTGPTLDQLMRHQNWFNNGAEQGFFL